MTIGMTGVDESDHLRSVNDLGRTAQSFRQRARGGRGLSLREVAEATGKSIASVHRFERGKCFPRDFDFFFARYALACGTSPNEILRDALDVPARVVRERVGQVRLPRARLFRALAVVLVIAVVGATCHALFFADALQDSFGEAIRDVVRPLALIGVISGAAFFFGFILLPAAVNRCARAGGIVFALAIVVRSCLLIAGQGVVADLAILAVAAGLWLGCAGILIGGGLVSRQTPS